MDVVEYLTDSLDLSEVDALAGGHQSRVFRATRRDGARVAVKSIDASLVDREELEVRLGVVDALADHDPRVCRPVLLAEDLIIDLAIAEGQDRYLVGYEFASGAEPDPTRASDAARMGAALSHLHESMRKLPAVALPVVSALRAVSMGGGDAISTGQLLHGDFSASNLFQTGEGVRIFDFDDCGYGPPEFDVANALYMVLFDQTLRARTLHNYETFRQSFVDGYLSSAGPSLRPDSLDRFIDLRVHPVALWLDDLNSAPIGLRNAPSAWHATLRSFVSSYLSSTA